MLRKLEKFSLPELEEKVLKFWKEDGIFEKSLNKNVKNRKFVFYEGPPTANGRPGIHHVLARSFKDVVLRYKTMAGFFVPRKSGWDTHGLPVEIEVEKELGLKSKKEIEQYGIAEFNKKCKESVWKYKDEWERLTERMGFWLDLKNPYVTYENSYIETLWWIIKEIWKKKLLYKGHKVLPWCTRCGTALSSHEVALGYKETVDRSVYVKFKLLKGQKIGKLKTDDKTYILAWTTTPWTLPGNLALAVGKSIEYSIVSSGNEKHIIASALLKILDGSQKFLEKTKGANLIGLEYKPLFDVESLKHKNSYKIYPADFVSTEDGTGVVHTAVMYGEDDYQLGKKIGLPQRHTVLENGRFTNEVSGLEGLFVKAKETEEKIIAYLEKKGNLLKVENYTHEYPFCWRCGTSLLYYARNSWFVAMSKLKSKLLANNKKINWIPNHLKEGRFGSWLKEVKDWAFSRERYWGTPLPIWGCDKCGHEEAIGSREELCENSEGAKNRYFVLRHGEAKNNAENIVNSNPSDKDKFPLTPKGRAQVEKSLAKIVKEKIDLIFSSDFRRAKETAEIVAKKTGLKIQFDERLREVNTGAFNGGPVGDYHGYFSSYVEKFIKTPPQGENLRDMARRLWSFVSETEKKYEGKKILIVSHEYPIWMLETVMSAWDEKESIEEKEGRGEFIGTGEAREAYFWNLPRNDFGFGDLHRPYVDTFILKCKKCNGRMHRTKEVVDVWFDSGAMPFAQNNYPFESKSLNFPADYISEGVDQTRGWFYTLLSVATLLGKPAPYKNVISLGLVLDKNGQKMSKSKGNAVNPWEMIEKYGVDAVRWYFYTTNPPGESKKFDETDLKKTLTQFINLIYNSFIFFDTYAKKTDNKNYKTSKNLLDQWIIARLNKTIEVATGYLSKYEIGEAGKRIEGFAGDLSRWFIRRSRRRLQKPDSAKDYGAASETLGLVLLELSKLLAPFMPFFAETLYKSLGGKELSVHLENWPLRHGSGQAKDDKKLIETMEKVRKLVSLALAKRAEAGIKVRQPLGELKLKSEELKGEKELLEILKDEINVKEIKFDKKLKEEILLDTNITHELKEEGRFRDFVRAVQGLRQDAKFQPKNAIVLMVEASEELRFVLQKNEKLLKREVNAKSVEYKKSDKFNIELQTKLDNESVWIALRKTS